MLVDVFCCLLLFVVFLVGGCWLVDLCGCFVCFVFVFAFWVDVVGWIVVCALRIIGDMFALFGGLFVVEVLGWMFHGLIFVGWIC